MFKSEIFTPKLSPNSRVVIDSIYKIGHKMTEDEQSLKQIEEKAWMLKNKEKRERELLKKMKIQNMSMVDKSRVSEGGDKSLQNTPERYNDSNDKIKKLLFEIKESTTPISSIIVSPSLPTQAKHEFELIISERDNLAKTISALND